MKKESSRRASNYQIRFVESAKEFQGLLEVFREVFDWEESEFPDSTYLTNLLGNPPFLVLDAKAEDKIVGGLTAYLLPGYQTKKSSIFIYDLGVTTNFQRQRIGKSLIDKLLDYAKKIRYRMFLSIQSWRIMKMLWPFTKKLALTIKQKLSNIPMTAEKVSREFVNDYQ